MAVILSCAKPCNVATLNPSVRLCLCVSVYCLYASVPPCPHFKDSFQSESRGPWLTAGLISAEISPIFYLLLNIYSHLNPVCVRGLSETSLWLERQLLATDLHICKIPEILLSLSDNGEANEEPEVKCQSWGMSVHVHHPQRGIKIVTIYSKLRSLNLH